LLTGLHLSANGVPLPLQPGQTLLFLGDRTSPGAPGYVEIMGGIIARFYPDLHLNLLATGSPGQTARGLNSPALMQIIVSSKPDWLVVDLGLTDALREPAALEYLESEPSRAPRQVDEEDLTFGPEVRLRPYKLSPASESGREPEPVTHNLDSFTRNFLSALTELHQAGVQCAVLTTILAGDDPRTPFNRILRAYNRAIRASANEARALLIDIEEACKDILDRALNYKQTVALASPTGNANPQGQALIARTTLNAFGILPQPGHRTRRRET
jgi:hypothetical protein